MNLPAHQRQEWIKSRREQRKLTRQARLNRQILRYILLVLLLVAVAGSFIWLPWKLTKEQAILIQGNKVVSCEQIKQVCKSILSKPFYQLDPRQLEDSLKGLGDVNHAFVRRYSLPSPKLVVEILEEFPWATYCADPNTPPQAVIAESGRMISIAQFPKIYKPELEIYGPSTLNLSSEQVNQWANWVAYIEKEMQCKVESIDLRQPQDVWVHAGDLSLKLGNPDSSLTRRLNRLASVLAAAHPFLQKIEYIDLSLDSNIPLKMAKKGNSI